MGLSSSKSKTTSTSTATPYAPAQPYIDSTIEDSNDVYKQQQPILNDLSGRAQQAFADMAPGIFQASNFVTGAQDQASKIAGGGFFGGNPGSSTYTRLQAANDPSIGLLTAYAGNPTSPQVAAQRADNPLLVGAQTGGNIGTDYAARTAEGTYLNGQPSAGLYGSIMGSAGGSNPFLESQVKRTSDDTLRALNSRFAASGMGEGMSTPYADTVSRNLADSANSLRYQDYNDGMSRALQAAGQSDAAFSSERGRMSDAAGLLSSNFNANADRTLEADRSNQTSLLSAAQANADRSLTADKSNQDAYLRANQLGLDAARSLGSQFDATNRTSLDAAKSNDANYSDQISQMLQALGLTGGLADAQYSGINPALNLLDLAAKVPYYGVNAQAGLLDTLAGRYGTTNSTGTQTSSGNLGQSLMGLGGSLGSAAILASDRRLKTDIERIDTRPDGLGVYAYRYIGAAQRFIGVMADEVARLRPDALGPRVNGFATVNYGVL